MKIPIRMFLCCIVLMIISACANIENDNPKKNIEESEVEKNKIVTALDPDKLTINGVKVGMTFTELMDRIPENSEVTLEDFNGYNYHFHFDDNQWTFYENGTLDFILIGKKGEGLDNLLKVGDSKELIEATLGEPELENSGGYIYEYSNFEIHIYLEEGLIDTIRMILRNIEASPLEGERIALVKFYEDKIKVEVDERKNDPMYPMTAAKALSILKNAYPEYTLTGGGEISYEAFNEVKGKDEPAYLYTFTSNETGDPYVGWVFADGAYKLRFAGWE